jgi:hypothetical protein
VWAGLLAAGAALLAGRYDWHEAGGRFARNGYLSSLYFFCLVLPTGYYLTLRLSGRPRVARVVAGVLFVVCALPYRLLGIAPRAVTLWPQNAVAPQIVWFPDALRDPGAPGDRALILGVFAIGALGFLWRARFDWRRAAPLIALVGAITLQTALHTSMRSPYTYIAHFERAGKWYHSYLLPSGQGAVNGDALFFTTLDEHFNGVPKDVRTYLIRRSFVHYLSSHFSYLFNPYYVFLVLNAGLWLLAALCTYHWVRRLDFPTETAQIAAALVATGNAFIAYVGQPTSYLISYAEIAISLYLFEVLLTDPAPAGRAVALFGATLGLCAASYDFFPSFVMFLFYARLRRVPLGPVATALGVALAVYFGYLGLEYGVLHLPWKATNMEHGERAWMGLMALLRHPSLRTWYELVARFPVVLAQDFAFAFTVVAAVLGVTGLVVGEARLQKLGAVLVLPAVLLDGYFFFGGHRWGQVSFAELPRFTYTAYPAIYLGAACLVTRARLRWLGWLLIGLVFVLHNADVFGFPVVHYHLFWPTPMLCDPYGAAACPPI